MKVLVDGDACPVKQFIEAIAAEYAVPVWMLVDSAHVLSSDYAKIIVVSQGKDAVDMALINRTEAGDIVVTQDYGVGALALGKRAYALHPNGMEYTNQNIDALLWERHLSGQKRRQGWRTCRMKPRTAEDDKRFCQAFRRVLLRALNKNTDNPSSIR